MFKRKYKYLSSNRIIDALYKFFLYSAIIHISIIFLKAIINRDISLINYFKIVEFDYFFSILSSGLLAHLLSFISGVMVFLFIYFRFTNK